MGALTQRKDKLFQELPGVFDQTVIFRDAVAKQSTARGVALGSSILNKYSPFPFVDRAVDIMRLLIQKEQILRNQRAAYIAISQYSAYAMSDEDRESFDLDMTNFIKNFDESLSLLKSTIASSPKESQDCKKHCDLIVLFLYMRLKSFSQEVQDMRIHRTNRLKNMPGNVMTHKRIEMTSTVQFARSALELEDIKPEDDVMSADLQLSSQQVAIFEHENALLLSELDADMGAIRQAEARLNEIAELFSLFSTKVVEQQHQIESIYDNIVVGKSNMDMALDQLRKYLKHGASFRLNILAIFVIAALSLLFLDWFQV
uniref:t-SNARE coiled-coil homology domain-containing protein n=1 Tax=Spongospora subterranea TaxID=70186 RepID=A0A0H5RAC7_9EUKA|eukprot:CRZ10622.1 hypothetical protein [Spongospora subterranea]